MRRRSIPYIFFVFIFFTKSNAQPKYEFRAVWIATVDNIDWPPKNSGSEAQKAEFIRQIELHKKNGINVIIGQVRPAADAFYPSAYEPWSQWLTGTQGKPPSPYYDPLQFMIEECHKRGLEFHAWLNPYRANFNIAKASIAPHHITRTRPHWFITYGDKKYFDPANKEARNFVVNVVRDIVKRYKVDAIHMDDYFYPYRIAGKEFPDEASYKKSGTSLSKDDWRRSNVDSIIKALSIAIKQENRFCRFGISPFSVWRNKDKDPNGSDSKASQTNYDDLYADILLWLKNGWIDYVAPQLYPEIGNDKIAFEKMLDWWSRNSYGRHVYIGHGIYRAGGKEPGWNDPNQLPNQIKLVRSYPNVFGSVYFSSKSFFSNPLGWNDSLRQNYYRFPALVPPALWIDSVKPASPLVEKKIVNDSVLQLEIKQSASASNIKYHIVYRFTEGSHQENCALHPKNIVAIFPESGSLHFTDIIPRVSYSCRYYVTAVSRNNMESIPAEIVVIMQPGKKPSFY
ncbi:MAG: family 10 glycosylhydrolase [Chitinophagaceae bacterium]|nr:family 10 glycosylhydrolase [Chitinophagaceae bacterium]